MKNKIDKDGNVYKKGWDGEYHPVDGVFGPKKDTNIFGNPNVERDFLGNPIIERNWLGEPKKTSNGDYLYKGKGSTESAGGGESLLIDIIILIIGMLFTLIIKLLQLIINCTKNGFVALSKGEKLEALKNFLVPITLMLLVIIGYLLVQKNHSEKINPVSQAVPNYLNLPPQASSNSSGSSLLTTPIAVSVASTDIIQLEKINPTISNFSLVITPDQFVQDYFSLINNKDYKTSWSYLSPHFKEKYNNNDFIPYQDWWAKFSEVRIITSNTIYQTSYDAVVNVELFYSFLDGHVDPYDLVQFGLVFDTQQNQWFFDSQMLIKGQE